MSASTWRRSERHVGGRRLERVRLRSVFLLRSVAPPPDALQGREVTRVERLGKRVVLGFEGGLFAVLHSHDRRAFALAAPRLPDSEGRRGLAAFDFAHGSVLFTESGHKKRASLHLVRGRGGAARFRAGRPGGERARRGRVRRGAPPGEPHAEARPHRPPNPQRHRQTPTPTRSCTRRACLLSSRPAASARMRSGGSIAPRAKRSGTGPGGSGTRWERAFRIR